MRLRNVKSNEETVVYNKLAEDINHLQEHVEKINNLLSTKKIFESQLDKMKNTSNDENFLVFVDEIRESVLIKRESIIKDLEQNIKNTNDKISSEKEELFLYIGNLWINYFPNKKLLEKEFEAGAFSLYNGRTMKEIDRKVEDLFNTLHGIK